MAGTLFRYRHPQRSGILLVLLRRYIDIVQKILSYPLYIVTWLMGVSWDEVPIASELLALKIAANEFAAYSAFSPIKETLSERTQIIITYALCGFGNFGSIGIQVGILGAIAPTRYAHQFELHY